MGLSNEERLDKMTWAAHHLTQLGAQLPSHEPYERLKGLCGQVWHTLLGGNSNGAHWIFGSSAGNPIKNSESPWAVALAEHFRADRADNWLDEMRAQRLDKYYNMTDAEQMKALHPEMEDQDEEAASIHNLLKIMESHEDRYGKPTVTGRDKVFLIYAQTENMIYALRRYDDSFKKGFAPLDKLTSDIQGECFNIFSRSQDFAKAYLMNQILEGHFLMGVDSPIRFLMIKGRWPSVIARRLTEHQGVPLEDIRAWHLRLERCKGILPLTDWIELAVEMMGPCLNMGAEAILRTCKACEFEVDEQRVKDACAKVAKAPQGSDTQADDNREHNYTVHGSGWDRDLYRDEFGEDNPEEDPDDTCAPSPSEDPAVCIKGGQDCEVQAP